MRRSRLKIFLLYFAPQFSVYTKFGIDPPFVCQQIAFHFRLIEQQLNRLVKGFLHHDFKFVCLLSACSKWIEPLLLTSSSVPAAAPETAGPSGAASRTPFASRSRLPCSPDRISQNPCSHGTGVCLTPGLLTLQFCLNDHRERPPNTMWLLCPPFITSSML